MKDNYFELLGVAENVSEQDLKRSFMRKVRKHPPHSDPDGYRALRLAYDTLRDEDARRAYVADLHSGGQLGSLTEQVDVHFHEECWDEAIQLLKRMLVLDPDNLDARYRLAMAYKRAEDLAQARKTLEKLVRLAPATSLYTTSLGHAYLESYNDEEDGEWLDKAEHCFHEAVAASGEDSGGYLGIAEARVERELYDEAIHWCNKAIEADGVVDFEDFEAFFLICRIHIFAGRTEGIPAVTDRIVGILHDEDTQMFAASLFTRNALQLVRMLALEPANAFADAARRVAPEANPFTEALDFIEQVTLLQREWKAIEDDESILAAVRLLVHNRLLLEVGVVEPEEAKRRRVEILSALDTWPPEEIQSSCQKVKRRCPTHATFPEIDVVLEACQKGGVAGTSGQLGTTATSQFLDKDANMRQLMGCVFSLVAFGVLLLLKVLIFS